MREKSHQWKNKAQQKTAHRGTAKGSIGHSRRQHKGHSRRQKGSTYIHEGFGSEQGGISGASDRQAEPLALLIKEHHIGSEAGGAAACEAHNDWQLLLGNAYQAALWEVKAQRQMLLIRWRPNLHANTRSRPSASCQPFSKCMGPLYSCSACSHSLTQNVTCCDCSSTE